jgi:hypothetical protein
VAGELIVGLDHNKIYGVALVLDLIANINIHDVVLENTTTTLGEKPYKGIGLGDTSHIFCYGPLQPKDSTYPHVFGAYSYV